MAQYLKEEVKNQIHEAALDVFSKKGFKRARLSDIASTAQISTGNIYRYYKNKDDLFYSVITESYKRRFLKLLRQRVGALNNLHSNRSKLSESESSQEEMLSFWIEHRRETIIILSKAEGSKYEDFSLSVTKELVKSAIEEAAKTHPKSDLDATYRFVLHRVFENTLKTIVSILSSYQDSDDIHALFNIFWTYHITGLTALIDE